MRVSDLSSARRSALDRMADLPNADVTVPPFTGSKIDAAGASTLSDDMVRQISRTLVREPPEVGPGAVLLTGLVWNVDDMDARLRHEELFLRVWADFRHRSGCVDGDDAVKIKMKIIRDGAIPMELYGSSWSFKRLHADRDALLFSHRYGPMAGFSGGELLLADARMFLRSHKLRFNDIFEWSDEPTAGSKPVLRAEYQDAMIAECGINLGVIGANEVLFVNNLPEAGILHGVRPVEVIDSRTFVREYHRVSVRRISAPAPTAQPIHHKDSPRNSGNRRQALEQ